ncbi:MAG: Crp/Fnr family transcriptional regulator [Eubacterium sp.]|nr:Crp/Fnr family transcriptional regulator [Eubacterium sp.]
MNNFIDLLKCHPLFQDLTPSEIDAILKCAAPVLAAKKSGEYILQAGESTENMGFVLSGTVMVIQEDLWGRRNIMSQLTPGGIFSEPFAAVPGAVLNVSVVAMEDCEILLLNVHRLLSGCSLSCDFHSKLIRNLVTLLAEKALAFNDKITHLSKRTTREKLLSYLSAEALRQGSRSFDIAFNRQQLADYLCVERSAMSVELSKLQKEGLLSYHKNHFKLKALAEL